MISHIFKIIWKNRRQNGLLLIELFICFLVLCGVFSFLVSNLKQYTSPLGFDTKNRFLILFTDYSDKDSIVYTQSINNLVEALTNLQEVKSYSFGNSVYPFSFNNWTSVTEINNIKIRYNLANVDEKYMNTMNVLMSTGRWFNKPLDNSEIPEVVVNELFIKNNFDGQNMVDSIVNLGGDKKIVGVTKNYKNDGEFTEEVPIVIGYQNPFDAKYVQCMYVHVNENTPETFEEKLSKTIINASGIKDFLIMDLNAKRAEGSKSNWVILIAISALAIFLIINIAMGLFGVLGYNINRRRFEISIRKAMGATSSQIMSQFTLETVGLALISLIIGTLFVWQVVYLKLVEYDAEIIFQGWAIAFIFILVLVTLCSLFPSWRASRFDPAEGLKEE